MAYYGYSNRINATIDEIAEIKKLCDAKKVNLKFVMNPIHKTTYLASDKVMYFEFLNKLATISDFYDFSGLNKITTNNYFYYETSHYRPIVGDAMLHYIQENKPIDSIPDFGTLVTKANIESRINTLMKQRKP